MGTSRNAAQLAAKFTAAARAVEQQNADGVGRVALLAKTSVLAEASKVVGSDLRMSRVGRSGAKLGARYDVRGTVNATAFLRAVGPWQLVERDTKPHRILPRSVGRPADRTRAGRAAAKQQLYEALFAGRYGPDVKPLRTPYGPRYSVNHPGTRGRHPFEKGVAKVEPQAVVEFRKGVSKALLRAFS